MEGICRARALESSKSISVVRSIIDSRPPIPPWTYVGQAGVTEAPTPMDGGRGEGAQQGGGGVGRHTFLLRRRPDLRL